MGNFGLWALVLRALDGDQEAQRVLFIMALVAVIPMVIVVMRRELRRLTK